MGVGTKQIQEMEKQNKILLETNAKNEKQWSFEQLLLMYLALLAAVFGIVAGLAQATFTKTLELYPSLVFVFLGGLAITIIVLAIALKKIAKEIDKFFKV
ncbi:MAG: hypothetical protein PHD95_00800 [Candidatus ainarchaeum sp.]|nr:hypothetical protein [Candidatus ainarchaeum sp.]